MGRVTNKQSLVSSLRQAGGQRQAILKLAPVITLVLLGLAIAYLTQPVVDPRGVPGESVLRHRDGASAEGNAANKKKQATPSADATDSAKPESATRATNRDNDREPARRNSDSDAPSHSVDVVRAVAVRDEQGRIIYSGDVDLSPTLDRIAAGRRLPFRHDGVVFENREGRLPRKPRGYYHEFVHPTPHVDGPGPQRVVTGDEDEVYYTHDHYRHFRRIR